MSIGFFINIIVAFNGIIMCLIFLPKIKLMYLSNNLIYFLIIILSGIYIYTYVMLIATGGLTRINFNLEEVYDVREQLSQNRFFLSSYFINWVGYSLNPLLIILGLYKKRGSLLLTGIIMQLLIFSMTNFKSFLYIIILLIVVYYLAQKPKLFSKIGIAVFVFLSVMYIHYLTFGVTVLNSSLIRRQFFIPAHLHFLYHDFFSRNYNPFIYFSDSILSSVVNYPYQDAVTRVISKFYWGREFGPNVGFFGNAYFNIGIPGVYLLSILLVLLLKIVQSTEKHLPSKVISALILTPFMALINSGFFTTLLTHSFLLTIITLWIISSYEKNKKMR
ncbi:MAG TPA: hypothetical protein DEB42_00745 [Jeotgalicoccus sp.]|nr:hypothetical protein [Jeotgalicoccus sp.]